MENQETRKSRLALIAAMCIFGTIGIVRKYIGLPSSIIALVRAVIGTILLGSLLLLKRQRLNFKAIQKSVLPLIISGIFLGFNWILLFEAYSCTTVATATLCYYMAPILVILVSPLLLQEKLTVKKLLCALTALVGMVLVSGVLQDGIHSPSELQGVLFGLGAAILYACVILLNKKIDEVPALDRTLLQLGISGIVLLPYTMLTESWVSLTLSDTELSLLIVAGVVHTGIAYALYFGSIRKLKAQTVALYSYIDPILAIALSAVFLQEPMTVSTAAGAIMILGATFISERK